jgi:hypothetical protein
MTTTQPNWKFLANLGDVSPYEGMNLVYADKTGVYSPEMAIIRYCEQDGKFTVSRIMLERCFCIGGYNTVSDNKFHTEKEAWFGNKLEEVANFSGTSKKDLIGSLCFGTVEQRALAYLSLVEYFGAYEFDQYPEIFTKSELRKYYPKAFSCK